MRRIALEKYYDKGVCYSNIKKVTHLNIPQLPIVPCLGLRLWEKFEIHGEVWMEERERGSDVIIL